MRKRAIIIVTISIMLLIPALSFLKRQTAQESITEAGMTSPTFPASPSPSSSGPPVFYISKFDPLPNESGRWLEFTFTAYTTDLEREDAVTVEVLVNNERSIWKKSAPHFDEETVIVLAYEGIDTDSTQYGINVTCVDFMDRTKSIYKVINFDVLPPRTNYLIVSDSWGAEKTTFENNKVHLDWRMSAKIRYSFIDANFAHVQAFTRTSLDYPWEAWGTKNKDSNGTIEIVKEWVPFSQQIFVATWYLKITAYDRAGNFIDENFILYFEVPEEERPRWNDQDLEEAKAEGKAEAMFALKMCLLIGIPLAIILWVWRLLLGKLIAWRGGYGPVVKRL